MGTARVDGSVGAGGGDSRAAERPGASIATTRRGEAGAAVWVLARAGSRAAGEGTDALRSPADGFTTTLR